MLLLIVLIVIAAPLALIVGFGAVRLQERIARIVDAPVGSQEENTTVKAQDTAVCNPDEAQGCDGTLGNDDISGSSRADDIYARGGADLVRGTGGADLVLGGEGDDSPASVGAWAGGRETTR